MAGNQQKAQADSKDPKLEWIFREFGGMNTQPYRTSIEDEEFYWLENVMPIGHGNLKVIPAQSAAQQTVASGTAIYAMSFNASSVDYHFVVCSDGSAYQILATSPFTRVAIGGAGAFTGTAGSIWAAQWKNSGIVIVDSGKGYLDWNITAPTTLTLIDATKKNNLVATYAGRVWMSLNRTVTYTDANSYNSFVGSGGSFVISDESLHDTITGLQVANNFLYIFGSASANAISDVRVTGGVAVFSNTVVQTSVGTTFPMSLFSYYRSLMFFTPFGMYALYGATPTKASDQLDGILPLVDLTKPVSGGVGIVYNQLCAVFAFTYADPVLGSRKLLAVFFNKKWFVASQGAINFVWDDSLAGVPTIFGTDGTSVFTLFSNTTASINSKVQTKLYGFESSLMDSNALRFGVEAVIPAQTANLAITIDTETGTQAYNLTSGSVLTFIGSGPISFVGVGPIVFLGTGFARYAATVSNWGKYLGATIQSTAAQLQMTTMMMEYEKRTRGLW